MAQNDFLQYAAGGSANVESQAAYAADPVQTNGFATNAVPPASTWNKALRQSASIAAMLAAFIAFGGTAMVDDGNAATKAAAMQAAFRIRLIANTTFYVATTGSDTLNTGLTIGSPWLTFAHAYQVIQKNYDLAGFVVTIQNAAGQTHTENFSPSGTLVGQLDATSVIIDLNTGVFTSASGISIAPTNGAKLTVINGTPSAASGSINNIALCPLNGGILVVGSNITFAAIPGSAHMGSNGAGAILIFGSYTATGAILYHYRAINVGQMYCTGGTQNLAGLASSGVVAACESLGYLFLNLATFSGSATGARYNVVQNGVINTNSGGATFIPGSSAGSTASGGVYS